MSEKILACPFCGNELLETYDDGESYYVFCSSCGAQGPLSKDKSDAILLWNAAANALAKKDDEIAKRRAALEQAEQERHEAVSKLSLALIREAAGDKRQGKLNAVIEQLRKERDAVTQELNQERIRANALERELSYRIADINRLRKEVEHLRAYLAGAEWDIGTWNRIVSQK